MITFIGTALVNLFRLFPSKILDPHHSILKRLLSGRRWVRNRKRISSLRRFHLSPSPARPFTATSIRIRTGGFYRPRMRAPAICRLWFGPHWATLKTAFCTRWRPRPWPVICTQAALASVKNQWPLRPDRRLGRRRPHTRNDANLSHF